MSGKLVNDPSGRTVTWLKTRERIKVLDPSGTSLEAIARIIGVDRAVVDFATMTLKVSIGDKAELSCPVDGSYELMEGWCEKDDIDRLKRGVLLQRSTAIGEGQGRNRS